jgi:aspartate oxidase
VSCLNESVWPDTITDHLKVYSTEFSDTWLARQRRFIQRVMSSVAIQTSDEKLRDAVDKLIHIFRVHTVTSRARVLTTEELEFQNILCVAKMILSASLKRRKNLGTFYKNDTTMEQLLN